jgi:hypothetical protein
MQFPLHLPCASMWLFLRTSMWLSFDCIEVADNRIVASVVCEFDRLACRFGSSRNM